VLTRSTLAAYPRPAYVRKPQARLRAERLAPKPPERPLLPSRFRSMAHLGSDIALSKFGRSGRLQALVRRRGRAPGTTPQFTKAQLPSDVRLEGEADSASSEGAAPSDSRDLRLHHCVGSVAWPVRIASCSPGPLSRSIRPTTRLSSISSETAAPSHSLDPRLHHPVGSLAWPVRIASCPPGPLSRPIRAAPTSGTYKNGARRTACA